MSARIDWGIFDKGGNPVAVGDEHARWVCPLQRWEPIVWEHPFTGEDCGPGGNAPVPCPWKEAAFKLERCSQCGMEFRYP